MKREREKKYVVVDVRFSEDGHLRPLQIVFDEEHIYEIDVGGVGDRYTCLIRGQERYLWFVKGRWFVEAFAH